jgi:hypothetical protein
MRRIENMLKPAERESLRKSIDKIGRLKVANHLGYRYSTLSGKLIGISPLGTDEAKKISEFIKSGVIHD